MSIDVWILLKNYRIRSYKCIKELEIQLKSKNTKKSHYRLDKQIETSTKQIEDRENDRK